MAKNIPPDHLRCTRHTQKGKGPRCEKWANKGMNVCGSHGGGYPKRVREGKRLPPGRPPLDNRYANINYDRVRDLIAHHLEQKDDRSLLAEIAASRALFTDFIDRYAIFSEALADWHESWRETRIREEEVKNARELYNAALSEGLDEKVVRHFGYMLQKLERGLNAPPRPRSTLDIMESVKLLGETGKLISIMDKKDFMNALTGRDVNLLMGRMGTITQEEIESFLSTLLELPSIAPVKTAALAEIQTKQLTEKACEAIATRWTEIKLPKPV